MAQRLYIWSQKSEKTKIISIFKIASNIILKRPGASSLYGKKRPMFHAAGYLFTNSPWYCWDPGWQDPGLLQCIKIAADMDQDAVTWRLIILRLRARITSTIPSHVVQRSLGSGCTLSLFMQRDIFIAAGFRLSLDQLFLKKGDVLRFLHAVAMQEWISRL